MPVRHQAFASWQWANYVFSQVPPGKRVLRVNFDETAICLFQGAGRGNVFLAKTDPAVQHVPLGKRRTFLTHVGFVCDDPIIQPLLPQVVVGNEHMIKAGQVDALRLKTYQFAGCRNSDVDIGVRSPPSLEARN